MNYYVSQSVIAVKFAELARVLEKVEGTSSRIEKTNLVAKIILEDERMPYLLNGLLWPPWEGKQTNVSINTVLKILSDISKIDPNEVYVKTGDIGKATEEAVKNLQQKNFFSSPITIDRLYKTFEKLSSLEGEGSQSKRQSLAKSLFLDASPLEARYLARMLVSEMRTGVADGIIRDAIAKATKLSPEKIERAYMITTDWRTVVKLAKEGRVDDVKVEPLHPIAAMLAHVSESIGDAMKEHERNIIEWKYDGARVQVHKKGSTVKVYSRRLEDVTESLPEIVKATKNLPVNEIIFEGEALALDKNGKVLPFQYVLRRFRRKHDVDKMAQEIHIEVRAFDLLYLDGKDYIDKPLGERRKALEEIFPHGIIKSSHALITDDPREAEDFYRKALDAGHEGVMIKDLTSHYEAGKRGRKWLKYKPIMEPLDLVITAAEWGDGKRAGLLGAFEVSVIDEETGKYLPVGKVGTGFTDEDLKDFTEMIKPLIRKQEGKRAEVEPRVIITVAYQEIQRSPKYRSGYALRFPRYVGLREDKSEPDSLQRLMELYELFSKKKKGS